MSDNCCANDYKEMSDKIKLDTVFSVVLNKGSTHNIVVRGKGEMNLFGNVAIERIIFMFDRPNQSKCEFGFCENVQDLENKRDINIIESTRVFVSLPRIVIIPYENIGLLEEGAFAYIESKNSIGTEIILDDKIVLDKLPIFKHYHSVEIGGFYQNPILTKKSSNVIPFKIIKGKEVKEETEKE